MLIAHALWKRRVAERLGDPELIAQITASVSRRRQRLRAAMIIIAAILLVLAVMRPRLGVREGLVTNTGVDIVLVLDVSKSMTVRDVAPNRLEAAKLEINNLLEKMAGGRIALVPFAGVPFVQCPLTHDFDVIRSYLSDLSIADMPVPGTHLGRALYTALGLLAPAGEDSRKSVDQFQGSQHRAIVVWTDGENHEGAPEEVAKAAAEAGVRIFTVGVGTATGDPVPEYNEQGTISGYLKDEEGNTVVSGLNGELLAHIANATGGAAFNYADASIADDLHAALDQLERREYNSRFLKLGEERFQWVLIPAFLLLLLELLTTDRRRKFALHLLLIGGLTMSLNPSNAEADWRELPGWLLTTDGDVDEGNALLQENPAGALSRYMAAANTLPESAELHLNVGLAHLALGDAEAAREAFLRALDRAKGPLKAVTHCHLGIASGRWATLLEANPETADQASTRWEEAVVAFEQCLLQEPTSADAAWNLEIALIALCRIGNDAQEPNNRPREATPLQLAENPETDAMEGAAELVGCLGDTDWITWELAQGDRFRATLTPSAAGKDASPPIVEMALFGPAMDAPIANAQSDGDTPAVLELPEGPAEPGPHFLRIRASDEGDWQANLDLAVRPPCASREEPQEDNDTRESAAFLTPGSTDLRICPEDPDWFEIVLGEGESLVAVANAAMAEEASQMDLDVFDAVGQRIKRGAPHEGTRIAVLLEPAPGSYFLRVQGDETFESPYSLQIQIVPPCPEGNDGLEPNDRPEDARPLETLQTAGAPPQSGVRPPGPPPQMPPGAAVSTPHGALIPHGTGRPQGAPMSAPPGGGAPAGPPTALLRICAEDVDHVSVIARPDTPQIATILFDHSQGDLQLALLDADGKEVLETSDASGPNMHAEAVALPEVTEETTFLVRIQGAHGAENFYVLRLDQPQPNPSPDGDQDEEQQEDEQEPPEGDDPDPNDEEEEEKEEDSPSDPVEEALKQLDHNPRNLEAEDAERNSPFRNARPRKDW